MQARVVFSLLLLSFLYLFSNLPIRQHVLVDLDIACFYLPARWSLYTIHWNDHAHDPQTYNPNCADAQQFASLSQLISFYVCHRAKQQIGSGSQHLQEWPSPIRKIWSESVGARPRPLCVLIQMIPLSFRAGRGTRRPPLVLLLPCRCRSVQVVLFTREPSEKIPHTETLYTSKVLIFAENWDGARCWIDLDDLLSNNRYPASS